MTTNDTRTASTPPILPLSRVEPKPAQPAWTTADAADLYRIDAWSQGYFKISPRGSVVVTPAPGIEIDLAEVVNGLRERAIHPPVLLRFTDILSDRLTKIADAFRDEMIDQQYQGDYRPVYPVKVNQQHHVVEELSRVGSALGFGLEVGSKPELLAVMAMSTADRLIICNGFKDARYIEAIILASKLGRTIVPVVENAGELRQVIAQAHNHDIRPTLGVRVKLFTPGEGRWKDSAGVRSKFGLFVDELLDMVESLREHDMLDCLKLLHCHAGSQIQNIRKVKDTIGELTHIYAELRRLGVPIEMLDIGGGLGVDYTGDQANDPGSMNYTLEEYAADVVYRIKSICDAEQVEHPTIVTECGRAMVAYSSVLIANVLGSTGPGRFKDPPPTDQITSADSPPQPLLDLVTALESVDNENLVAGYHDAQQARDEAASLFSLGHLTLEERATAERLFWATCHKVRDVRDTLDEPIEALDGLDELLSDVCFLNLSIFQSLPDAWAIDQIFPAMPIQRLHERPDRHVILADVTCDSDGKLDQFLSPQGISSTFRMHATTQNENYDIAFFLVGAYQETLGDLHNLFGDTHAVHVSADHESWTIDDVVKGDTASEVLRYLQYDPDRLLSVMNRDCERAVRAKRLTVGEARTLMRFYESGLSGSTYLEPTGAQHP